jgi:hypothetical protein
MILRCSMIMLGIDTDGLRLTGGCRPAMRRDIRTKGVALESLPLRICLLDALRLLPVGSYSASVDLRIRGRRGSPSGCPRYTHRERVG